MYVSAITEKTNKQTHKHCRFDNREKKHVHVLLKNLNLNLGVSMISESECNFPKFSIEYGDSRKTSKYRGYLGQTKTDTNHKNLEKRKFLL